LLRASEEGSHDLPYYCTPDCGISSLVLRYISMSLPPVHVYDLEISVRAEAPSGVNGEVELYAQARDETCGADVWHGWVHVEGCPNALDDLDIKHSP
jgi:hypothetical protein